MALSKNFDVADKGQGLIACLARINKVNDSKNKYNKTDDTRDILYNGYVIKDRAGNRAAENNQRLICTELEIFGIFLALNYQRKEEQKWENRHKDTHTLVCVCVFLAEIVICHFFTPFVITMKFYSKVRVT